MPVDANVAAVLSAGVTASLAVVGVVFTSATKIFKTAANKQLALITEADGRFDRALQTLYNAEPNVRAGSAYVLAQMALPGKEKNARYFATAYSTLCSAVRFDRDVYVNDATFTAIATLYPSATADGLTNLQSLNTQTERVFAQHVAEYVLASGESREAAGDAICGAAPEVLKTFSSAATGEPGTVTKRSLQQNTTRIPTTCRRKRSKRRPGRYESMRRCSLA